MIECTHNNLMDAREAAQQIMRMYDLPGWEQVSHIVQSAMDAAVTDAMKAALVVETDNERIIAALERVVEAAVSMKAWIGDGHARFGPNPPDEWVDREARLRWQGMTATLAALAKLTQSRRQGE